MIILDRDLAIAIGWRIGTFLLVVGLMVTTFYLAF